MESIGLEWRAREDMLAHLVARQLGRESGTRPPAEWSSSREDGRQQSGLPGPRPIYVLGTTERP